ncbi:YwdI family protein [Peribacillus sp. NPDC096379]|uniref:YwdI family protein n=1 Tax=Peribacillus sp. NPDC096379 TaxID=3364393 RepID=UPI003819E3AF
MEVPSGKILDKMGELVAKAKQAESKAELSGYVLAIQALCDVLHEGKEETATHLSTGHVPVQPQALFTQPIQPQVPIVSSITQMKPVKIADANGDSLFDF